MDTKSRTFKTATYNRLVHDPNCTAQRHSTACYIRETDKHQVTKFYGVEEIDGAEIVVTDEYDRAEDVPTPTARQMADRVDFDRIVERLEQRIRQRARVNEVENPRLAAWLDARITKLRGLLS